MDNSTFQSPYSTAGIKTSASTFNFSTPPAGAYSTHPAPTRSDRPTAVAPLPLHLQTKGGKIGKINIYIFYFEIFLYYDAGAR